MEGLLTPVSTSYKPSNYDGEDALTEVLIPAKATPRAVVPDISTANEALEVLRGQPSFAEVLSVLQFVGRGMEGKSTFSIKHPSPATAQLVNVLVSETIPNYWSILNEKSSGSKKHKFEHAVERRLLISSLRSLPGLNAILARLKACIQEAKGGKATDGLRNVSALLKYYLSVLESLLEGEFLVELLWNDIGPETLVGRKVLWREISILIAGGRLTSIAAEASSFLNESSTHVEEALWIADSVLYCQWIGRNVASWVRHVSITSKDAWKSVSELLAKALRLGYPG